MADETVLPYRGFDIWMMGNGGNGCIAINGRAVKKYPAPTKWDVLKAKAKEVIEHFWDQPNAQDRYLELCLKVLEREKDYYL